MAATKTYERRTESAKTEKVLDEVAAYIRRRFNDAVNNKRETQDMMLRCLRQRKGIYDPEDSRLTPGVDIYMNVTGEKCRAAEAWLKDILVNNQNKPWTLNPTPVASLSGGSKKMILQEIKKRIDPEILGVPGALDSPMLKQQVKQMKNVARYYENEYAKEAAVRMSTKIEDQMLEGGWREAISAILADLATFSIAVIKTPVFKQKKVMKWDGDKVVIAEEVQMATERVSPFDIYPAPYATMPNEGYMCEVMRFARNDLLNCIDLPHFNEAKIRYILDKYEDGYRVQEWTDAERLLLESNGIATVAPTHTLDIINYWGPLPGTLLDEWGVEVEDEQATYEVDAWIIDDICCRCLLNPNPLGDRPYRVTSYEKIPGSFFGNGVAQLVRDIQRVCNASARNLVKNMSYASGPITEIDSGRMSDEEAFDEIIPYKVYFTSPDPYGGGHAAIKVNQIPSNATELMAVYEKFEAMADNKTGIPKIAYGPSGAQPRSLGVFTMQLANASKGIKNVLQNLEIDIIEPSVKAFWAHNMLHDDDDTIKGDVKVIARGASGLLQQEHLKAQQHEFFSILPQFLPILPQEDTIALLRKMAEGLELDFSFSGPGEAERKAFAEDAIPIQQRTPGQPAGPAGLPPPIPGYPPPPPPPQQPQAAINVPNAAAAAVNGQRPNIGPIPGTPPLRMDGRQFKQGVPPDINRRG